MCGSHLQVFDAGRQRRRVAAVFAARGVDVALDGVLRLVAGLVERAQVHPGRGVTVIQLHGTDVGLQRVHGLILLLIQHANRDNTAASETTVASSSLTRPHVISN